ncbi:MAG: hypothetical protein LUD02_02395 [Tannerellaceae bacterium]|nr:hypothetical protein [Tannerellaceae bacterium]
MHTEEKKIAYIDICGTVFYSNTTFDFFHFYFKGKRWRIFTYIYKTFFWKVLNKISLILFRVDLTRKIAVSFLKNKALEELSIASETFYDQFLHYKYNQKALKIIEQLRSECYEMYYTSATLDFIASTISQKSNIPVLLSTELAFENNICLGKYKKEVLNNKLELLENKNMLANRFIVLTDNLSDFPLVIRAEKAYVFSKKKNLAKWQNRIEKERSCLLNIELYEY